MRKREINLYKSGKRNKDGYKFNVFTRKEKRWFIIAVVLCIFTVIVTVLESFGITNWHKLNVFTGVVDGVKISDTDFAVYYLDVGQSDCSVVVCDGEVMVIDTGSYPRTEKIKSVLKSLEVEVIDYLVITHQHDDHMSGAEKLIKSYTVENIIMPKLSENNSVDSDTYNRLLYAISNFNVNPIGAQNLNSFNIGSANVDVLAPNKQYNDLNNMSIVMKITYGDTSFLFQGDAESQVENSLLFSDYDLSADVLKLGHHGSKTSTTENYLDAVKPDFAVISCGQGNNYGHPRVTVMDYLVERNIDYFITFIDGDITVGSDGNTIKVETQYSDDAKSY